MLQIQSAVRLDLEALIGRRGGTNLRGSVFLRPRQVWIRAGSLPHFDRKPSVCVCVCVCMYRLFINYFHQWQNISSNFKKITILDKILLNFPHHSAQNMFSQKVKKQRKRWAHLFSPNLWLSWRRNSPLTLYFLKMIDETSHLRLPVALSRCPSVTLSSWVFRFDPGLLMEVMPWSH